MSPVRTVALVAVGMVVAWAVVSFVVWGLYVFMEKLQPLGGVWIVPAAILFFVVWAVLDDIVAATITLVASGVFVWGMRKMEDWL